MKPILVLQHVPHETLGMLEAFFQDAGFRCRYVPLFAEVPEQLGLDHAAGLVVLGGPMNVDEVDRYPYLGRETSWLREAVAREVPLLGICLGAQLLAKSVGARVYPNRVKEIGWTTRRTAASWPPWTTSTQRRSASGPPNCSRGWRPSADTFSRGLRRCASGRRGHSVARSPSRTNHRIARRASRT